MRGGRPCRLQDRVCDGSLLQYILKQRSRPNTDDISQGLGIDRLPVGVGCGVAPAITMPNLA